MPQAEARAYLTGVLTAQQQKEAFDWSHPAVIGGLLGSGVGGLAGLADYIEDPRANPFLSSVGGGALTGGLFGGGAGLFWNALKQVADDQARNGGSARERATSTQGATPDRTSPTTLRKEIEGYYANAPGGLDKAVELAQKHMQDNPNPSLQGWDPEGLDRSVNVTTVDAPDIVVDGKRVGGVALLPLGRRYADDVLVAAPGHAMNAETQRAKEHELTHASLQPKNWSDTRGTHTPVMDPPSSWGRPRQWWLYGPGDSFGDWNRYVLHPDEFKAHMAPVKREWVKATGRQMETAKDAEEAIQMYLKGGRPGELTGAQNLIDHMQRDPRGKNLLIQQLLRVVMGTGGQDVSKVASADAFGQLTKHAFDWSGAWQSIKHHAPRIRLPDTAAGMAMGGLAGLGTYGVSRMMSGNDPRKKKPSLWKHLAVGAGLGGLGGNVVGDRARRYLSNNMVLFGYDPKRTFQHIKPTSWGQFYDTAIRDVPNPAVDKMMEEGMGTRSDIDVRRDLARHGMGLPASNPSNPALRPLGDRQFTPDAFSGGVAGTYPAYEFNPDYREPGTGKGLAELYGNMPRQLARKSQEFATDTRAPDDPVHPRREYIADILLSRHGYRGGEAPGGRKLMAVNDLWDFAHEPGESKVFKQFLTSPGTWKDRLTDAQRETVGTTDLKGAPSDLTQGSYLKLLGMRKLFNDLVLHRGGVVFDQAADVTDPNNPTFYWQGGMPKSSAFRSLCAT